MKFLRISFFFSSLVLLSCGSSDTTSDLDTNIEWLIPVEEVFDGGPGKDGIPSVDSPQFSSVFQTDFLNDDDLVVGVVSGGGAKAYPHNILNWHEIVNDRVAEKEIAINYCPLTGTAIGWDRFVDGSTTEFGVSGKLYNTNLILYDRKTDSYWSQIALKCINGELINTQINTYQIIETSWATWKTLYPSSLIMNLETGFNRDYGVYPYGDYITSDRLNFPVSPLDNRLQIKERVLGVVNTQNPKAYRFQSFETGRVVFDKIDDKDVIIVGSKEHNLLLAFENQMGLEGLEFNFDTPPIIAKSDSGIELRVDGRVFGGPQSGEYLNELDAFIGYWFSFGAFYENIEIFEN